MNRICLKGLLCSSFLLAICLTVVDKGYGQDASVYAPLIEKDTKLIARIDISKIDFSKAVKKASEVANPFIDSLVENMEERNRAKASIPLLLGMMTGQYAGVLDALKSSGVQELYIVSGLEEQGMSNAFVAVPVGTKSKDELRKIREAFATFKDMNINLRFPFVRHGFIIVPYIDPVQDDDDAIKAYIKQRFTKLTTVADPGFAKGIDSASDKALVITSVFNENTTKEILSGLSELEHHPMVAQGGDVAKKSAELGQKFLEKTVKSISAVTYSFDLNELAYTITIRMKSAADIETLKKEFAALSENAVKDTVDKDLAEGTKKMMDSLAPVTNGDTLSWKIDPSWIAANRDFIIKAIKKAQAQTQAGKAGVAPAISK